MTDLFADVPEEVIEKTLCNIRENLHLVAEEGAQQQEMYTDVQVYELQTRLSMEDVQFATSFLDFEVAYAVVAGLLKQCYEKRIMPWLRGMESDTLPVYGTFRKPIGYGLRAGDRELHEDLHTACLNLIKDADADWGFRVESGYPVFSAA